VSQTCNYTVSLLVMQLLNQPLSESVIPVIRSDCQYISQLVSFKSVSWSVNSVSTQHLFIIIIGPLQGCHQDFKLPVNKASGQRSNSWGFLLVLFFFYFSMKVGQSCIPYSQGTRNNYEPLFMKMPRFSGEYPMKGTS